MSRHYLADPILRSTRLTLERNGYVEVEHRVFVREHQNAEGRIEFADVTDFRTGAPVCWRWMPSMPLAAASN